MTDDGRMACYADIASLEAARGMPLVTIDEIEKCLYEGILLHPSGEPT